MHGIYDYISETNHIIIVKWDEAETAAADRRQWRTHIAQCALLHGRG
jgi:hypothetical protein